MRRTRSLLLSVVLLAIVAVACAPQEAVSNRVLIVGDSLTDSVKSPLTDALTQAGWDPKIEAQVGTTIDDWSPKMGFLVGSVQPGIVVVELGTNNCLAKCFPLDPYIDQLMRAIPSSEPVLWLNSQEDVPEDKSPNRSYVNDALERATGRWPNMYLIDFSGHFAGHPEWHVADLVHFNDAGKQEFARFLRDELDSFKPS